MAVRLPEEIPKRKGPPRIRGNADHPCNICLRHKAGVIDIQTTFDNRGLIERRTRRYYCKACEGRFSTVEIPSHRVREMMSRLEDLYQYMNGLRRQGLDLPSTSILRPSFRRRKGPSKKRVRVIGSRAS